MARDAVFVDEAAWWDRTPDYRAAVDRACAMQDVPQVRFCKAERERRDKGKDSSCLLPSSNDTKPPTQTKPSRSPCAP